jgi:A/G-specific adenine glycosylase
MKDTCQSTLEIPFFEESRKSHPPTIREFRSIVLDHYRTRGRELIWRRTTDPYCILVSEIMLQQTRVERVAQKFPVFIAAFPDFESLAGATLADVLAVWQGMGYNRRAISLQKCAQRVIADYGGMLPADAEILATFPGIGRATASSICAFAFNQPVVFIETNIRRVFIHFFFLNCESVTDAQILPLVKQALYQKDPRTWYNALMDLGTDLKKTVPNPNRRSRHYTRQSAFEGSDRKIRGIILKILLTGPAQEIEELIQNAGGERDRVLRIIGALKKEGFLKTTGNGFAINGP